MTMTPVLEYAIAHQATARAVLVSQGIPPDDIDDVVQQALVKILMANPAHDRGPATYWRHTLRSVAADYWKRRHQQPLPFSHGDQDGDLVRDREDSRQDSDRQIEVAEALRQAEAICHTAPAKEWESLMTLLRGEQLDNAKRQRLHHLRKRLRAAVA